MEESDTLAKHGEKRPKGDRDKSASERLLVLKQQTVPNCNHSFFLSSLLLPHTHTDLCSLLSLSFPIHTQQTHNVTQTHSHKTHTTSPSYPSPSFLSLYPLSLSFSLTNTQTHLMVTCSLNLLSCLSCIQARSRQPHIRPHDCHILHTFNTL